MGEELKQLAMQTAGGVIGQGMGLLLGNYNDRRQRMQQDKLNQIQIRGQKEMTDYNFAKQLQMWKDTNYAAQMGEIKGAGLNPGLLYGMSGGGATTTGGGGGSVQGGSAPAGGGEAVAMAGMGIQTAANTRLLNAQAANLEADTELKKVGKPKTVAETGNINADTENKILQQVITKYLGKEAQDQYERIKAPNRGIEAKTYQEELEARQGIAGTIYELWQEGKLADKANAEIEQLLLNNAKTAEEKKNIQKQFEILEENLKGVKLDNIIKELEKDMQTQTGIDKSAPAWMKILARLWTRITFK